MPQPPIVRAPYEFQAIHWSFRPIHFLETCAAQYGDCFVAQFSKTTSPWVFISHPETVAQIFANPALFDTGRTNDVLRYVMGDHSTLLLDGDTHRRRRKLLMPPFHGDRMRTYGELIVETTRQVTRSWRAGQTYAMMPTVSTITLEVMLSAVFGMHVGERFCRLQQLLQTFLSVSVSPWLYMSTFSQFWVKDWGFWSPRAQYEKLRREVDELIFAEIRDRRAHFNPDRTDILTLLLSARDEQGQGMTDQELRDELVTMLVAGHDSSSATIAWALYYITTHPVVRFKLLAELDALGSDPEPIALTRLPYLNAVCAESLRLRSAGPMVQHRLTNQPVTLMGYEFPANTLLTPSPYLTHHRSDLYPNPHTFRPERFIDRQYSTGEYYPFGGGNRYCIGAAFAQFEMKLVIATILRYYHLTLAQKSPILAVRRGVNIAPQGGVKMTIHHRPQPRRVMPMLVELIQ